MWKGGSSMKVVAFLPAKGSSERIESKNIRLLDGKPLFLHTLEKLSSCDFIDEVYLDSESEDILNLAPYLNYIPLKRDSALANNKVDGHQIFYNEVCQVEADIYIQILGTSPFIRKETIRKGIEILKNCKEYDSVVLVKREKQYTWNDKGPNYDKDHIPNSDDLLDTIIETMGLYIVRSDYAHEKKKRIGDRPYLLEAEAIEAVDVNYLDDFYLAEMIARGKHKDEVQYFTVLANHLNSCLLSDTLYDLGYKNQVVVGLIENIPTKKILGRANTLKIRKLKEGEDFRGIYKCLKTYNTIREGEIILIENECPDRAYFGDLNCNLAIRSGAIGTVINGVTRDINKITEFGYPVFSRGYCCCDVRGVATIESHNQEIKMNGVRVCPGDLVFADNNGVVIIPKKIEKEIINRAINALRTEKSVIDKIIEEVDAYTIYEQEGAF